jgi:hypothetical protein
VEAHAATDSSDEDALEAAWQQLDAAELAHKSAEEEVAAATAEFEAMVLVTNQIDGLAVRVVDTNVHTCATWWCRLQTYARCWIILMDV